MAIFQVLLFPFKALAWFLMLGQRILMWVLTLGLVIIGVFVFYFMAIGA